MFENLSDRLQNAIHKIKGYGKITEDNISEVMREVRLALLEADVNYKVVKEFTNNVKEKALGEEVQRSLKPGEDSGLRWQRQKRNSDFRSHRSRSMS